MAPPMRALILGVVALSFGCGVSNEAALEGDEVLGDDTIELSSTKDTFIIARRDTRRCVSPMCGGFWVKDLNSTMQERYVSGLDFTGSGLSTAVQAQVHDAPDFELVLQGRLGPRETRFGTRPFLVLAAYRGMPGKTFEPTDKFYGVFPSKIGCASQPCAYLQTTRLNRASGHTMATDVSVEGARAFGVDADWLLNRTLSGRTVVAGRIVRANRHVTVEAHQIFIALPDQTVPCPAVVEPECAGLISAWERDSNRCLHPVGCTPPGVCARLEFECEPGYALVGWMNVCPRFACEPAFLSQP